MVKHGSVQPDGVPMLEDTLWNLLMHVSPLLAHVLSLRRVEERIMSTKGTSAPYKCTGSQMAHAGNNVLIDYDRVAHNQFFLEFG